MALLELADRHADELRLAGRRAIREAHEAGVAAYYGLPDGRIIKHMPSSRRLIVELWIGGEERIVGELEPENTDADQWLARE